MTDQPQTPEPDTVASAQPVSGTAGAPAQPAESYAKPSAPEPVGWSAPDAGPASGSQTESGGGAQSAAAERPEIAVGGAFAGGFLLAMILKRLAK